MGKAPAHLTPVKGDKAPIITKAEARGDSRPAAEGHKRLAVLAANSSPTTGLDQHWESLKMATHAEVVKSWGGATIDSHTGQALPQGVNKFALTVKEHGLKTISIPEGSSPAVFNAAMDQARQSFGKILERQGHHLGVFHDDDHHRIDFDPVIVTSRNSDVETIGAASRSIGGAYNFKDGNGYWPPHVV